MPDLDTAIADGSSLSELIHLADKAGTVTGETADPNQPDPNVAIVLECFRDKDGNPKGPKGTQSNAELILENDPRWKEKIWEDQFRGTLMFKDREYKDSDDVAIHLWMDRVYNCKVPTTKIAEVVRYVGEKYGRNPLTEYLNSLEWDGKPRIGSWLIEATGAADTKLNREVGRRWLIQAVARAMKPGCKADCCLILIGPQGKRKSTLFRYLAGDEFFSDTPMDIGAVNSYIQIRQTWIYEVAELDSIRRSAVTSTKQFLSACYDIYRPPYGRRAIKVLRHVCFCGTTNEKDFLKDPTGSRRFWPVEIQGQVKLSWIQENRNQLWAQAVHEYQAGVSWWLEQQDEGVLHEQNIEFSSEDPWKDMIEDFMVARGRVASTSEILKTGLKLDPNQMTRIAEMRVAEIMRTLNYQKCRIRAGTARRYVWKQDADVISFDQGEKNG